MAKSSSTTVSFVLLFGLLMASLTSTEAEIGVCYGINAENLPPANEVISMYKQYNIQSMRLYAPNDTILNALSGTNIEVMLGVEEERLDDISSNQASADDWVQKNVKAYDNVNFKYIAVGNEVNPINVNPMSGNGRFVGPAMENIQNAISKASLANRIKVSTAVYLLVKESFPPSNASFRREYRPFLDPIIGFLVENQSPLLLNMYPYFSYTDDPRNVDLQYALFQSPSVAVNDGQLEYQNLFDALLDAVYSALEKAGGGSLRIVVSETGWPSAGGDSQVTTKENARIYNSKLIQHVKDGTPKKPGRPIETYLFAMFDENKKPGNDTERNFGLFFPNKQPKYPISFN